MYNLTGYEKIQLGEIEKWKTEEPSVVQKTLGKALGFFATPANWVINQIVPEKALVGVLEGFNGAARFSADYQDILRDAKVFSLVELQKKDLALSDKLANEVHNWAIGLAITQGALTGATGLLGMAINIPIVTTLALRTIHKIGLCYGFEAITPKEKDLVIGILSAAGANTMAEKNAALFQLKRITVILAKPFWKFPGQELKQIGYYSLQGVAKQVGVNLTKRKAAAALPAIGGIVGGSIDGWFIKEVGWAARRTFQEMWLAKNGKLEEPIDVDNILGL